MRILITGSSGEIGTNLALRLKKEGHEVFGVDRRPNTWTDEFPYILQDLSARFVNFTGGIGNQPYPHNIDVVVHLAANAKVHQLVDEPWRALDNITITFNVLEFCRENKLPVIFASSREVYGDVKRFATEESQTHVSYTESTYSASKISGEALVYSYAKCYDMPYIVFRFSNVYGRFDSDIDRMERVIPLFIHKISKGETITVYGKDKMLDFTYVDDCVSGIVAGVEALAAGTVRNETINLAYGEGHTLGELVAYIADAQGTKPHVIEKPAHVGEVTHYVADISKAKKLLQYAPKVPLKEGIKKAIAWQKEWDGRRTPAVQKDLVTKESQKKEFVAVPRNGSSIPDTTYKILILSAFFPPFRGGAEVFVEEAGKILSARGHAVTVLTARLSGKLPKEEVIDGMRVLRLGFGIKADKYLYPALALVQTLRTPHDIVYGVLESYAGIAVALYKLLHRSRPAILNLQSGTLDDWRRGFGFNLLLRRFVHGMPDAIHAISHHLASRAKWLGAKHVTVIPNGIHLSEYAVGAKKEEGRIICVGRLYPVKGQEILLEAMPFIVKAFPHARLELVGDGPQREKLEIRAKLLGIAERVVFRGNLPHADIPSAIAHAQVFVGPSRREGQGIAFVEAMAAGTAVVGSNVGGIPEVIEDGVTGLLVPPENPQALARAVLRLLGDKTLAKKFTEEARKRVIKYDWKKIAEEVETLITNVING